MKKLLLLITYNVSLIAFCSAQNPLVKQWDYRFGGTSDDVFSSFLQTTDGGYILGGWSGSDSSGDRTQHSRGKLDYWIIKLDSSGIKQWDKRFGGKKKDMLYSLQQCSDGGYILGGSSLSGANGDKTQPTWGDADYWIVKTDSLGNKQWDKRFGGNDDDFLVYVQQTTDGGYVLGGFSASGISGDKTQPIWDISCFWGCFDYWIVKVDSSGNKQWDKDFGGNNLDYLLSIQQTTDGGYILGGHSYSSVSGDKTQPLWGGIYHDYWVVKIDSIGNKQWDKDVGGTDNDWLRYILQSDDRGFILAGEAKSEISGDKTQANCGGLYDTDYWIVKIDSLGVKQWDKVFGGTGPETGAEQISQTADGGYLISGTSLSPISCDKSENNLGNNQVWIVKTDSLFNKEWDKTILTTGDDLGGYVIQTKEGCYAIANYTFGGIGGYKTQPAWSDTLGAPTRDYWIVKFCDSTSTTSITQLPDYPNTFSIYPNPANEVLVISGKALGKREIEIYDLFGRRVLHSSFNIQHSLFTIDISKLSPGIYFLRAGNEVRKFVKE